MDTKKRISSLKKLMQADIDAVYVYNRAMEQISDNVLHERLTRFLDQHMKHIGVLSHEIRLLGDKAPGFRKDLKGHVLETITALLSTTGMKGAMTVLKMVEEQTNEIYGSTVSLDFPSTLKENLRAFFSEEKIHLDYINENLKVL